MRCRVRFALPGADCPCTKNADKQQRMAYIRGPSFTYGKLSVDWCRGSVSTPTGCATLLRTELRLLGALLETPGEPVNAYALIRRTWPDATLELTRYAVLRVYMRSLRRRLRHIGVASKLVIVRGRGYRLVP